jgi:sec-independent protein translocase protein TatA
MGGIGGPELLLVFVVVLLVFGPRKIPEVARGLGRGLREFRRLSTEFQREMNLADALEEEDPAPRPAGPSPGPASGPEPPEEADQAP